MPYIGTQPKDVRSFGRAKFDFTATQGQTAFTGADDDSKTLGFTDGQIEVYVNGILMDDSDFTTSNGNTVTLASAANLNDIISIVALQTDIPNSDYVPISGGTFTGAVTHSGTTTLSGNVTGDTTFTDQVTIGTNTNLLSNGDFTTNTTGWTATGSTLAIVSNELQLTPGAGVNGFANQQVDNLVIGRSYIASVTVTVDAGNYSRLYIGTSANGNQTVTNYNLGTGTHSFVFTATATTHHFSLVVGGGTQQVTRFDNAKLIEANRVVFPAGAGRVDGTLIADDVFPSGDGTKDIGASQNRFKDLYLSSGIYVGGTGAANHLDDYEEGTWTPTIIGSSSNPTVNYASQIGTYRKVGKLLYLNFYVSANSLSGGGGYIEIGGLPFGITGSATGGYPFIGGGYYHFGGASTSTNTHNVIRWQANASPVTKLAWYGSGGNSWSTGWYEISGTGTLPVL